MNPRAMRDPRRGDHNPDPRSEVRGGRVETYDLDPRELGVARASPEDLGGGSPSLR